MEERKVTTWEQFIKELDDLKRERDNTEDCEAESSLLFRGQENSNWWLSTTLERKQQRTPFKDYYAVISKIKPQIESLTNNQWAIPEYPEVERLVKDYDAFNLALWSGRCPAYAYMAYLRHHGFPSPLLDWTRSPYVAAYFAFSNAIEDANNYVSIYIFSKRRFTLSGNNMRVVYRYGPYVKTHRRHFLQQSEYTLCLSHEQDWRFEQYDTVFDSGLHQQGTCWRFAIPAGERRKVLKLLDEHNLNAFSLFGSEESMMETLAAREFDYANAIEENASSAQGTG
jgi:hypothetical protein